MILSILCNYLARSKRELMIPNGGKHVNSQARFVETIVNPRIFKPKTTKTSKQQEDTTDRTLSKEFLQTLSKYKNNINNTGIMEIVYSSKLFKINYFPLIRFK